MQFEVTDSLCHLCTEMRTNGLAELVKKLCQRLVGSSLVKLLNKVGHQFFELVVSEDFFDLFNSVVENQLTLFECFVFQRWGFIDFSGRILRFSDDL